MCQNSSNFHKKQIQFIEAAMRSSALEEKSTFIKILSNEIRLNMFYESSRVLSWPETTKKQLKHSSSNYLWSTFKLSGIFFRNDKSDS